MLKTSSLFTGPSATIPGAVDCVYVTNSCSCAEVDGGLANPFIGTRPTDAT